VKGWPYVTTPNSPVRIQKPQQEPPRRALQTRSEACFRGLGIVNLECHGTWDSRLVGRWTTLLVGETYKKIIQLGL
jgi:hypothetical protein